MEQKWSIPQILAFRARMPSLFFIYESVFFFFLCWWFEDEIVSVVSFGTRSETSIVTPIYLSTDKQTNEENNTKRERITTGSLHGNRSSKTRIVALWLFLLIDLSHFLSQGSIIAVVVVIQPRSNFSPGLAGSGTRHKITHANTSKGHLNAPFIIISAERERNKLHFWNFDWRLYGSRYEAITTKTGPFVWSTISCFFASLDSFSSVALSLDHCYPFDSRHLVSFVISGHYCFRKTSLYDIAYAPARVDLIGPNKQTTNFTDFSVTRNTTRERKR